MNASVCRMKPADQQGVTLVELMIAMVIGLVILGVLTQVFISGKSSYSLQDRLGQLQENGRYALYFLQRDIRMAGFPLMDAGVTAFVAGSTLDGGGNASDQIAINYRATVAGTDCLGNNVAVDALVTTIYSINVDTTVTPNVSRLMCSAQGVAAQPLVDGIENLQLLYGVDTDGDGSANRYLPASSIAAADWNRNVVSVRAALLASTITPVAGDMPGDNTGTFVLLNAPPVGPLTSGTSTVRPRGRVFTSTVTLRNRTSL